MANQEKAIKIVNDFKKYLQIQMEENIIKENIQWELFLLEFIQTGKVEFQYKTIVFNQEKLVAVNVTDVLAWYSNLQIAKNIITFNEKQSIENYSLLLDAYYLELLTFITSVKKPNSNNLYLESDVALFYILTSVYFPNILSEVEDCVLKHLAYLEKEKENNVRAISGNYGRDNILYLAYYIAQYYNKSSHAESILKYCKLPITEVYQFSIENIFSDNNIVTRCVNTLIEYHVKNGKFTDLTYPFHVDYWIYFPIEIISLLFIRKRKGLSIEHVDNSFFKKFLPFINSELPIQLSENTRRISKQIFTLNNVN